MMKNYTTPNRKTYRVSFIPEVTRLANRRREGKPDEMREDSKGVLYNYTVRVLSEAQNEGVIKEVPKAPRKMKKED